MPVTPDELALRDLHGRACAEMERVLASVGPTALHRATPCAEWDVQALLEHHAAQSDALTWAIQGGGPDPERWQPRPLDDAAAAVISTATSLRALLDVDRVWDRRVWMPEISEDVTFTTARVVALHLIDTMVHAWDVAMSIGNEARFDRDVLRMARDIAGQGPDGPARTSEGAAFSVSLSTSFARGTLEDIVAVLGRDPAWEPPTSILVDAREPALPLDAPFRRPER